MTLQMYRRLLPVGLLITGLSMTANAELNPGSSAALWTADLEFDSHAGMIRGDDFLFATLNDSELQLRAGSLERGRVSFPHGRDAIQTIDIGEMIGASPERVFAIEDGWLVLGDNGTLARVDSDFSRVIEAGAPLATGNAPVSPIEKIIEYNGVLHVSGGSPLTLASVKTSELASGSWATQELCECPGAAIVATHSGVRVIGGEVDESQPSTIRNRIRRVALTPDGLPESVEYEFMPMYRSLGPATAAQINNLIGVVPQWPAYRDEQIVRQLTLVYATDQSNSVMTPWREAEKQIPRLDNPILVPDPIGQRFYVLGGKSLESGERNTRVWGIQMPGTDVLHAQGRNVRMEQHFETRRLDRQLYSNALDLAREGELYHVVFLYDDSEQGREFRTAIQASRDIRLMLEDLVISRPADDAERADIQRLANVDSLPAMVLMDSIGNVLTTHEGVPNRQDVFNLMRPVLLAPGF